MLPRKLLLRKLLPSKNSDYTLHNNPRQAYLSRVFFV
ncbi:MAG: hypothetical protein ACI9GW_003329 [Halieaceae bacterium]